MRYLINLSALIFGLVIAFAAQAVDFVTVTPGVAQVNPSGATMVRLRWTVSVSSYSAQNIIVTSPTGTLSGGGFTTSTGTGLSKTIRHPGGGASVSVVFTENLRVDRTTASYIATSGGGVYERTFTDTVGSPYATSIDIVTSPYGDSVALQDYTLLFDDRTQYRVVRRGEALTAIANVTSSGRGTFDAVWEIKSPNGGAFRPFGRERVIMSGPRATTFESPPLPTNEPGQYRIRFSIGGGAGANFPEISYVVAPPTGDSAITLHRPGPGGDITGATRFEWSSVTGAARYRVEFLAPGTTRPLAAVDVRKTQTQLRPFTLARIKGLGQIVWRVTAYDGRGRALARSQARVLGSDGTYLHRSP